MEGTSFLTASTQENEGHQGMMEHERHQHLMVAGYKQTLAEHSVLN